MIEIDLLGAFAVRVDGRPIAVGGGRQGELLARLAIAGGLPLHRDRICDDLWDGEAPASAVNKVQAHVGTLRRALGRGAIRTAGHGYALGDAAQVDLTSWRAQLRGALVLAEQGDDLAAMAGLSLAAEQWTGAPLSGLGDAPFLQAERRALEELFLEGAERSAELRLRHGYLSAAIADLGELVERHPLHEGLVAQLVLATAMTGRQVEALLLHDRARARLAEEFGLEPGPKLRDAQDRVLRGLLPVLSTAPARDGLRLGLPHLPDGLVGRARELALLDRLVEDRRVRLVTLTGLGGAGKTRLAEALVERRSGSACWVSLRSAQTDAARTIAEQLGIGIPGGGVERLAAALVTVPGPLLLVLDDVGLAAEAEGVVQRLLIDVPALTVVATGRRPLGLPAERVVVVEALPTGVDDADGAVQLLLDRCGRHADVLQQQRPLLAEIAELCGGLPLLLELAAARARLLPLAQLRDRLADVPELLGGTPDGSAIAGAVGASAALLPEPAHASWAAASVFAGDVPPDALAAVRGVDLGTALDHCAAMLDLGLLRRVDDGPDPGLRLPTFVREVAAAALDRDAAARLHSAHATYFAAVAGSGGFDRIARASADLRAAIHRRRSARDSAGLVALLVPLAAPWCAIGDGPELVGWVDELLDRGDLDAEVRLDLLLARVRAGGQDAGPEVERSLTRAAALLPWSPRHAPELVWLQARCGLAAGRDDLAEDRWSILRVLPTGAERAAALRGLLDRRRGSVRSLPDHQADSTALVDAVDALSGVVESDEAARACLAALAVAHAADRFARCRLVARLAVARLLDGRMESAGDSERALLRLVAGSAWTREKLTTVLVAAAQLAWRGGRGDDAAFLVGLWSAGLAALRVVATPGEGLLLDRYLRRAAAAEPSSRAGVQRSAAERLVTAAGVHAAVEGVVQALLDGRAVQQQAVGAPAAPARREPASELLGRVDRG